MKMESLLLNSVISSNLHRLFHQTPHHTKQLIKPKPFISAAQFSTKNQQNMAKRIAVIGCGISGSVCASTLAKNGMSVTMFDQGRGPGGRMSQRREMTEDGKELMFDHGAPFFTITDNGVMDLVREWEQRGFVAEWKEKFGSFDFATAKFGEADSVFHLTHFFMEESTRKKYVGIPGMNSICKTLCNEPGVEPKFGVTVANIQWLEETNSWSLIDLNGQALGHFDGLVASHNSIVNLWPSTGRKSPLDLTVFPELAVKLKNTPAIPRFALMLAFPEHLSSIPVKGFSFKNSEVLSWAYCDSSKPGRSASSECWVLHSTEEYARTIISQTGLQKPSNLLLTEVAEKMLNEFLRIDSQIPKPFFTRAHRWGGAFPATAVAEDEKCLWDASKKLAICGDFCVSPNVQGAVVSGVAAAVKFTLMSRV
ncbi:uncharacterized protein LOC113312534 [Papaver somniferum]|uniref:uncharacterized protein LOC113312534 n=1 Tax=Papaver somniferum TaxID=3469 RepID=UPI000E6FD611|nr:uncharacterized protein LOC113312534 [Papaver somniferum]